MMNFLALHSSVVVPALIALLGGAALGLDVLFVRPARRARESELVAEPPQRQNRLDGKGLIGIQMLSAKEAARLQGNDELAWRWRWRSLKRQKRKVAHRE